MIFRTVGAGDFLRGPALEVRRSSEISGAFIADIPTNSINQQRLGRECESGLRH
jgi:hypothetical protein